MNILSRIFGQRTTSSFSPASQPLPKRPPIDPNDPVSLINAGEAPDNLVLEKPVSLRIYDTTVLPEGLSVPSLHIKATEPAIKALPARLSAKRITIHCAKLEAVGAGLNCQFLDLKGSAITALPDDVVASERIDLEGCRRLKKLPDGLKTGSLVLRDCVSLEELPAGLDVAFLDLAGCSSLKSLPDDLRIRGGRLNVRDCAWLTSLPDNLGSVSQLDISGCLNLTGLPGGLEITSWIDIGGSGIDSLPAAYDDVGLRWRGVVVSRRIVFEPHSLTPDEIFSERNAEVRRVMMERYGYERLMEAAQAEELDRDTDAGGERRLLRIPLQDDEDLICISVQCPSTGHKFVLRVPPQMTSCRQAVAWTAGFDDPSLYRPSVET